MFDSGNAVNGFAFRAPNSDAHLLLVSHWDASLRPSESKDCLGTFGVPDCTRVSARHTMDTCLPLVG